MTIHYAYIHDEDIYFAFSTGKTRVQMSMPYSKFIESVDTTQGRLRDLVTEYINQMFNLADLLS